MVNKGNHPQMAELFRLVNYYNLPRFMMSKTPRNGGNTSESQKSPMMCGIIFADRIIGVISYISTMILSTYDSWDAHPSRENDGFGPWGLV